MQSTGSERAHRVQLLGELVVSGMLTCSICGNNYFPLILVKNMNRLRSRSYPSGQRANFALPLEQIESNQREEIPVIQPVLADSVADWLTVSCALFRTICLRLLSLAFFLVLRRDCKSGPKTYPDDFGPGLRSCFDHLRTSASVTIGNPQPV
jgi:hypothetical protein